MDIEKYLAGLEIFSLMSAEDRERIASKSSTITYEEGQYIIKQGEKAESVWVIHQGRAKVIKEKGGEKKAVAVLMAGEVFGEMSAIQGRPATADVVPLGKVEAVKIPGQLFKEAVSRSSSSMGKMAQTMTRRFFDLMKK